MQTNTNKWTKVFDDPASHMRMQGNM